MNFVILMICLLENENLDITFQELLSNFVHFETLFFH